jgi:hypothetical protein
MQVRTLTENGIAAFSQFVRENPHRPVPHEIITGKSFSSQLTDAPEIEIKGFDNRFEFGKYLVERLSTLVTGKYEFDTGLWSWLAAVYFDEICPLKNGKRQPSRINYYVLEPHEYKRYYHHMARTPYMLVSLHQNDAEVLLTQPLHRSGEIIEQFASRQDIVTNKPLIEAISKLYLVTGDDGKKTFKRGSAGKNTGGTFRRLGGDIVNQFDLTYDLRTMSPDAIISMLPSEFDRFKPETVGEV